MQRLSLYRLLILFAASLAALAQAATYSVSDQPSCTAIPGATWTSTGSRCNLGSNLTLSSGDSLTVVSPVGLGLPDFVVLSLNGGVLRVQLGAKLFMTGGTLLHILGTIDNHGFWDIRTTNSNVVVFEDAVVTNTNQIHLIEGRIDNHGLLRQAASVSFFSISRNALFRNFDTLVTVAGSNLVNEGRVENSGFIDNGGTIENHCADFINTGTVVGNALIDPHCWRGGAGLWSVPSNWSHGVVPPANGDVAIEQGTATLDFNLAFSGILELDLGHLVIGPTGTFTNSGLVRVNGGGNFPGTTSLRNQGTFINNATLQNGNHFINDGVFANHGTISAGGSVGVFFNSGTWGNQPTGVVTSQGIDNAAAGLMVNYGQMQLTLSQNHNSGRVINFNTGIFALDNRLRNHAGASLFNFGAFSVTHRLTQPAGIDNEAGARIQNEAGGTLSITAADAYINNAGLVRNDGAVANGGILNNTGVICGTGSFSGNPIAGNAPIPACLPSVNAGPDQSVGEGTMVTLDGSASSTPKGTPLAYTWTQTAGPAVLLSAASTARPTFRAPFVPGTTVLSFRLVVNDGYDTTLPDFVDVAVFSTNSPPVADAGDDRTAKPGTVVALDSSHSYDPDGNLISFYEWTQVAGPPVTLVPNANVPNPSFTVPAAVGSVLVFKLREYDDKEFSVPSPGADPSFADTVAITIVDNSRPVAVVGPDRSVAENSLVLLDGGASFDNDAGDVLAYEWRQVAGAPVSLVNPTSPTASFTAPFTSAGSLTTLAFELVVRDNDAVNPLASLPRRVNIGIYNANDPPRCDLAAPSIASLSPPDSRMSTVGITGVIDDSGSGLPFTLRITGVRQDEPVASLTPADPSPDAVVTNAGAQDTVQLRRERSARGNGRVYTIAFTAHDGWEGCSGVVKVEVPVRRNDPAVDDGPLYDSTAN